MNPDALQDVVTVRRVVDQSPRTRMGRSQTQVPPPRPVAPPTQRSLSQDSMARANKTVEKAKAATARRPPNKKGSSHADVIDAWDLSGVGATFHHDGPFDACAPSRNRHKSKAPMLAWSGAADADRDAFAAAREIPNRANLPYPSPSAVYAPYEPPAKKRDAIAEAWGIHEPEPFEDFSAGGGYTHRPGSEHPAATTRNGASPRRNKDTTEPRESSRRQAPQPTRRGTIPPPQPIFVPESDVDNTLPPSPNAPASPSAAGAPKRTKSLMHRIRKMRDAPNVPVGPDTLTPTDEREPSPTSSAENSAVTHSTSAAHGYNARPTHRSQNSFLGRMGRGAKEETSPTSDGAEQFVYVNEAPGMRKEKSLPAPPAFRGGGNTSPGENGGTGYFDSTSGGYVGSPGAGLGRRTSLLKKMKGVVKGAAK